MKRAIFHWVALVAIILLIGAVVSAKAAKAQSQSMVELEAEVGVTICGAIFETARLAYVRDAAGIRAIDVMRELEMIFTTGAPGVDFSAVRPIFHSIILEAYARPKLTMGVVEAWDRQITQDASRFGADVEARCLMDLMNNG
jgi:hypothetical protein